MISIDYRVYRDIIKTVGNSPIESGGIIGMRDECICEFYFDKRGKSGLDFYVPSVEDINCIISRWSRECVRFIGIVHSHPNLFNKPSKNDIQYFKKILDINRRYDYLICPIVTKDNDDIYINFYKVSTDIRKINVRLTMSFFKNEKCRYF